jgi:hypothetical protein
LKRRIAVLVGVLALIVAALAFIPTTGSGDRSSWDKAVALVALPNAEAHRYHTSDYVKSQVYDKYNHLCGTVAWGWTWCWRRQVDLSASAYGDHSWQVRYTWDEAKPGTLYGCGILVQVYDHAPMSYTTLKGPSCAI